jgi:small subunit ribosomal protein S20
MPNIKSQIERARISKAANERNSSKMSALRTALKKAKNAINENSQDKAKLYDEAVVALNRANTYNLLHKKNISRKISKLTKAYNKSAV